MIYTRAQARDVIRQKLHKLTSVEEWETWESGTNTVGDPASMSPAPTNRQIDTQLNLAIDFINQECQLGYVGDVTVTIPAQTANGPYPISLRDIGLNQSGIGFGDVMQVRRAYYDDGSGWLRRVSPKNRESFETPYYTEMQNVPPYYAMNFYIEGYTMYFLPPPSVAGTLHIIAGTGLIGFRNDQDTIDAIPSAYHDIIYNAAAWKIASSEPNDVEMLSVAKTLEPRVMRGLDRITEWKRDVSSQEDSQIVMESDRIPSRKEMRTGYYGFEFNSYR